MTTFTATYKRTRIPTTTVSYNTVSREYKAIVNVTGLDPDRTTSGEESLQGIVSLNPPTVVEESIRGLTDLAIQAVANSAYSTRGFRFGPNELATVSYSVSYAIQGAIELIEAEQLS